MKVCSTFTLCPGKFRARICCTAAASSLSNISLPRKQTLPKASDGMQLLKHESVVLVRHGLQRDMSLGLVGLLQKIVVSRRAQQNGLRRATSDTWRKLRRRITSQRKILATQLSS